MTVMNSEVIIVFISAAFSGALAFTVAWHERRSIAHWAFTAGMLALALEGIFAGLAADAALPEDVVYWQDWRLVAMSCLPGLWLFFSLSYGRGNYREFLKRWSFFLILAFAGPIGLAVMFREELIASIGQADTNQHVILRLGTPGVILNLLFLLGAVLVLMNIERTFRASVGTMRWRILGLGVLFAVRAYTSSQALLFHAIDLPLQTINAVALLVGCMLILRSLLRAGHFDMDVYPSQSVLHNSLTVLLAGIYLLVVGIFAKVVTFLGGDAAFTLKAFVVLVALVLLTICQPAFSKTAI
jgi:hypothetical protein